MMAFFWLTVGFFICMAVYEMPRLKSWYDWLRSKPWERK